MQRGHHYTEARPRVRRIRWLCRTHAASARCKPSQARLSYHPRTCQCKAFSCRADQKQKLFITQELQEKTTDPRLQYYAPARVDKLVGFIITGVIFMLLILPVVALYELSNVGRRESPFEAIGILIIFTLLFAAAMSALTKATRQELFAASAAYCAVLVVFISNFSTQAVTLV